MAASRAAGLDRGAADHDRRAGGRGPVPVTWTAVLLAVAPVPLALITAFAPAPVARLAAPLAVAVLVTGMIGQVTLHRVSP